MKMFSSNCEVLLGHCFLFQSYAWNSCYFSKYDTCVSSLLVLMSQEQAWVKLGKRRMNFTRKQNFEFGE